MGRGKLDEIRDRLAAGPVDVVVFNGELRPTMHHLLERELHVECYDRLRVLLELFAQRASSREGKLQVELALLQYEVPLLREWIHEADIGERPGFMAGGEQRVDAYLETVKRRIKRIRDELESIRRGREARRTLRKERGYHLVALAGYANAGKTSLLNALADERLLVEDRMFSTLSTATRLCAKHEVASGSSSESTRWTAAATSLGSSASYSSCRTSPAGSPRLSKRWARTEDEPTSSASTLTSAATRAPRRARPARGRRSRRSARGGPRRAGARS